MNQNTWAFQHPKRRQPAPFSFIEENNNTYLHPQALARKIKTQKDFFPKNTELKKRRMAASKIKKLDPRIENSVKCQEAWIDPEWLEYLDAMEKLAFQPKKRGWQPRTVRWITNRAQNHAVPRKTALAAQSRALLKPAMDIMNKPKPEKPFIPDYCI